MWMPGSRPGMTTRGRQQMRSQALPRAGAVDWLKAFMRKFARNTSIATSTVSDPPAASATV